MTAPGCSESGLPTGDPGQEHPGRPGQLEHQEGRRGPAGRDTDSTGRDPSGGIRRPEETSQEEGRACRRRDQGQEPGPVRGLQNGPSLPCAEESSRNPAHQEAGLAGSEDPDDRPGGPAAAQEDPRDPGGPGGQERHWRAEGEP